MLHENEPTLHYVNSCFPSLIFDHRIQFLEQIRKPSLPIFSYQNKQSYTKEATSGKVWYKTGPSRNLDCVCLIHISASLLHYDTPRNFHIEIRIFYEFRVVPIRIVRKNSRLDMPLRISERDEYSWCYFGMILRISREFSSSPSGILGFDEWESNNFRLS